MIVSGSDVVNTPWTVDMGNIYKTNIDLPLGGASQLFVSGQAMEEARWPNNVGQPGKEEEKLVYFTTARVDAGSDSGGTNFIIDAELPFTQSSDLVGAYLVSANQYTSFATSRALISSYDPAARKIGAPLGRSQVANTSYFVFGNRALLDVEEEWWYDDSTQTLYFYAPGGVDPNTLTVEYKTRRDSFDIRGRNYIVIDGLVTTANRVIGSSNATIRNVTATYVMHEPRGAASYSNRQGFYFYGGNNLIENSEFAYSSNNLVDLEGGNNNRLINSYLHHGGYSGETNRMVKVAGIGSIISHNTLSDNAGGYLLRPEIVNGLIQNNHFFNGTWFTKDSGLIYSNYIDAEYTQIRENVFHDHLQEVRGDQNHGVYFDSGTNEYIVANNVFYNFPSGSGLMMNTFSNHLIYNNTFYDTKYYISSQSPSTAIPDPINQVGAAVTANNLFAEMLPGDLENMWSSRNLYRGPDDPRYADAPNADFELLAGSAAIDKGVFVSGVTDDFVGYAPDLGALEQGVVPFAFGHDFDNPPPAESLVIPPVSLFEYRNLVENSSFESTVTPEWVLANNASRRVDKETNSDSNTKNGDAHPRSRWRYRFCSADHIGSST